MADLEARFPAPDAQLKRFHKLFFCGRICNMPIRMIVQLCGLRHFGAMRFCAAGNFPTSAARYSQKSDAIVLALADAMR
jgi:hypothetical protein